MNTDARIILTAFWFPIVTVSRVYDSTRRPFYRFLCEWIEMSVRILSRWKLLSPNGPSTLVSVHSLVGNKLQMHSKWMKERLMPFGRSWFVLPIMCSHRVLNSLEVLTLVTRSGATPSLVDVSSCTILTRKLLCTKTSSTQRSPFPTSRDFSRIER